MTSPFLLSYWGFLTWILNYLNLDYRSVSLRRSKRGSDRKRTSFKREEREKREREREADKEDSSDTDGGTVSFSLLEKFALTDCTK